MLSEIENVKQYDAGRHRRWFHDEYFDIYLWENPAGEPDSFQLCYAKNGKERVLRWSPRTGYIHDGVDAPEDKPGRAMSALFVADGAFDADNVGHIFEKAAINLPENVKNFVMEKIRQYSQADIAAEMKG